VGAKNVSLTPEADGAVEVGLMFPHSRGIEGHGKLHSWWNQEPHVVVETVGDSGLIYKVRPEKGGKENTLHRNALKLCVGPIEQEPEEIPAQEKATNVPTPILYFPPGF